MPIANYTTTVSAVNSMAEIQKMLVAHGAKAIMTEYAGQEPCAMSFIIPTKGADVPFKLPANIEAMQRVLTRQLRRTSVDRQRASRVAWRVLRDWIRAQLAILETEMVTLEQVMLPYMTDGHNRTLYEVMKERQFLLDKPKEVQ